MEKDAVAAIFGVDVRLAVALVSALVSLIIAVVAYVSTRSNQRDVEHLKARLADQNAERNARRDYEYEARKRLYRECGPLIFQLAEQAELALNRIHNLARAAANGNLDPGKTWLAKSYYRLSTFHRFLSPLATLKLIQHRLTHVDLSVDKHLRCQYAIGKQVVASFGDDFDLARLNRPPLRYDPHNSDAERLRMTVPEVYWQQGIPAGILDNAVEALIVKQPDGGLRVMSFTEFENEHARTDSGLRGAFNRISYLFDDFHPRTRPVLWRLLLAQAQLYRVLLRMPRDDHRVRLFADELCPLGAFSETERQRLDWRQREDQVSDDASLVQPFDAVAEYVRQYFRRTFETRGARDEAKTP